jgi:hypothetical protein
MPHDLQRRPAALAFAASGLLCLSLLTACGTLTDAQKPRTQASPLAAEVEAAALLARHIEALQQLVQGSPAEQAEIVSSLRVAYEQSHQAAATMRYAFALAAPGHPARDPARAQQLLREALATPERLAPVERGLALIELQRVDAELRLTEENQRLTADVQRERNRDRSPTVTAVAAKRLQAEIDENAKLRRALEEARAKLDAIANIERNITDRKTPTEGRRP